MRCTNGAVALVYVVATIAMAFTAWSYAEMSRVVPHAGSVFAYASTALGTMPGFLAGWLAMLDYLLISGSRISFPAFHFTRSSLRCRSGPSPSAHLRSRRR